MGLKKMKIQIEQLKRDKNAIILAHYHTIRAESEEVLDKIDAVLKERGYIAPEI